MVFTSQSGHDFIETLRTSDPDAIDLSLKPNLNIFPYRFAVERKDQNMLEKMLESRPVGVSFDLAAMWSRMFYTNTTFFQSYSDKVSSEVLVDLDKFKYHEWSVPGEVIDRYYGLVEREPDESS